MPPHHRAFTDSVESRQKLSMNESASTSSATHLATVPNPNADLHLHRQASSSTVLDPTNLSIPSPLLGSTLLSTNTASQSSHSGLQLHLSQPSDSGSPSKVISLDMYNHDGHLRRNNADSSSSVVDGDGERRALDLETAAAAASSEVGPISRFADRSSQNSESSRCDPPTNQHLLDLQDDHSATLIQPITTDTISPLPSPLSASPVLQVDSIPPAEPVPISNFSVSTADGGPAPIISSEPISTTTPKQIQGEAIVAPLASAEDHAPSQSVRDPAAGSPLISSSFQRPARRSSPSPSAAAGRAPSNRWPADMHQVDRRPVISRSMRATSHDGSGAIGQHRPFGASTSQSSMIPLASTSSATLDPDHHWLSEDEARGSVDSRQRRIASTTNADGSNSDHHNPHHRRRRGHGLGLASSEIGGDDTTDPSEIGHRGSGAEHKHRRDLVNFGSTVPALSHHSIHHRPSNAATTTQQSKLTPNNATQAQQTQSMSPYAPADPPLARLVPILLSLVTCRSCNRLYRDPTTLPCGHAVCLSCSHPVMHRPIDLAAAHATISPVTLATSESLFARNPALPTLGPSQDRHTSQNRIAPIAPMMIENESSEGHPRLTNLANTYRGRLRCPQPDCKGSKETRSTATITGEAKVDFVLQKVLDLVRNAFPGIDRQMERARLEVEEENEGDADVEYEEDEDEDVVPMAVPSGMAGTFARSPSGSSTHSGGGGEEVPTNEDDSKRSHITKAWQSSKRRRRRHPHSSGIGAGASNDGHSAKDFVDLRTAIIARLELDNEALPSTLLPDILSELECQICFQLLQDPVTSQCGHTFCQKCLARAYDHSDKCPLCRYDFPTFIQFQSQPINMTTQRLILSLFPSLAADRFAQLKSEERGVDGALDTPLFVCTLAWPNLPTYIHIFEPRYRLMIRRAMEGNREFGMVLPSRDQGGINEYGTMLKIQSCNMIEDGRSIIETVGSYRFRVLEKGTLDGYTVGRIERVDDIPQDQEDELERRALARNREIVNSQHGGPLSMSSSNSNRQLERSTAELMNVCLEFVSTLRNGSAPWVLQRLNNTIGPMPTNAADFSFWMAEVMPVDDQNKALLLQITSPRERLRLLVFWIEQFRSSWWFSRGCNLM